jgi:uncharacterized membrane protein
MVFLLPGFALARTIGPKDLGSGEGLVSSVALSVIMATCVAVLLAATRLGLSRETFGLSLSGFTITLSLYGMLRVSSERADSAPELAVQRVAVWLEASHLTQPTDREDEQNQALARRPH